MAKHLVVARLLDIQNLSLERQDCLEAAIASLFCCAACGFTLDQVDLATIRLALRAVGQFAGQSATVERSFATGKVASLSRCLTGTRSFDRLVDDLAGDGWILLEKGAQPLIDKRLNRAGDVGVELAFGLPFELWLRKLYAYYGDQAFTNIVTGEVLFEVFEQAELRASVVDGARKRGTESGEMRATVNSVDVIRKAED